MATRERNCQFGVDEQSENPCGECRRCCDELKAVILAINGEVNHPCARGMPQVVLSRRRYMEIVSGSKVLAAAKDGNS